MGRSRRSPSTRETAPQVTSGAPGWPLPLRAGLPAVAALFIAAYVVVAILRMAYPFELEFIEGAVLVAVRRLLDAQPLYAAPTLDYVPLNYTPLYFWLGALVSRVLGPGFVALRLLSFLCSIGTMALVFALVRHETRSRSAGFLAAGLYAACFPWAGSWYDLARADSLWLFLLLAGIVVLRVDGTRTRAPLVAAACFALAYLAKQSAIVVAAPVALHALLADRRRGLILLLALGALLGASHLALDASSHGWYSFYAYRVALAHAVAPGAAVAFWTEDMLRPLGIATLVALFHLLAPSPDGQSTAKRFHLSGAAGLVACAWWLRLYPGGYNNVLMPAYAALAILFGLGWHGLGAAVGRAEPALRRALVSLAAVAVLVQFALLAYNPARQLPSRADRDAGQLMLARLRGLEGETLIPRHGYLLALIGRPPGFHEMPFLDVAKSGRKAEADTLMGAFREALRAHRWSTIILDDGDWLDGEVNPYYAQSLWAYDDNLVCWPKAGMRTRPSRVLVPRTR